MHSAALILFLSVMIIMAVNSFAASDHGGKVMSTSIYGDGTERLVNGTSTKIENYPYCVAIIANGTYICGGSIIAPEFVVTAAHCCVLLKKYVRQENTFILAGTTNIDKGGQRYNISNVSIHEKYNRNAKGRPNDDICLIKLDTPIEYDSTKQQISLPTRSVKKDEKVTIVAWGRTGKNQSVHNDLREIIAKVISLFYCRLRYIFMNKISKDEFCTYIERGTGTCNADSGSGIIRNNDQNKEIVGLVSGGVPCAVGYPDISTNVYSYNSWIYKKMKEM